MSDSPTAGWIDEVASWRRAALIKAMREQALELVTMITPPRPEPTLPSVPMCHPKPRVSRPSKALRTGGKR